MLDVRAQTGAVAAGASTVAEIVAAALARADADTWGAWVALDRRAAEHVRPLGPLSGATVGVKDLFPVAGLPCRVGSALTPPAPSEQDAAAVARLRDLGAAIVGTTSLPEFALGPTPGARNPLNPAHTPGSSSAGCAIAVAAGHVTVGLATQTNGSIIRPAAYCGVAGLKPTQGTVPGDGMPHLVPTLDQPGFIAVDAQSLQIVWSAWTGTAATAALSPVTAALVRSPRWDTCTPSTRTAVEATARALDATELRVPDDLADAWSWMETIICVELAESLAAYDDLFDRLTDPIQEAIRTGRTTTGSRYEAALAGRLAVQEWADGALDDIDVVVTPATAGPAPRLEDGAGSPALCTLWSLAGVPALTIPVDREGGLPIGVQLVAARGRDSLLLSVASAFTSPPRPSNQENR